jgi:PD-(D/E)XK nuclease superfamily
VTHPPSKAELVAAHCWENDDSAGTAEMTAFRRRLRYEQARWREAQGYPIGTQPLLPRPGSKTRPLGSRMPLDFAQATGANFLTDAAHEVARERLGRVEAHQRLDAQRVWADLLWSLSLCFNLFGDLAADLHRADRAVHTWWPDAPGTVCAVRFAHSPGRLDASYLGNLGNFDVAFELDVGDATRGIIGVLTKYHERAKPRPAKPERLARYRAVATKSGVFKPKVESVDCTDLLETWVDHLLVHAMLQHPSNAWSWGRFVVVHAAGNLDYAGVCERYRTWLDDDTTFDAMTIEDLLASKALPRTAAAAFRKRYLTVAG